MYRSIKIARQSTTAFTYTIDVFVAAVTVAQ